MRNTDLARPVRSSHTCVRGNQPRKRRGGTTHLGAVAGGPPQFDLRRRCSHLERDVRLPHGQRHVLAGRSAPFARDCYCARRRCGCPDVRTNVNGEATVSPILERRCWIPGVEHVFQTRATRTERERERERECVCVCVCMCVCVSIEASRNRTNIQETTSRAAKAHELLFPRVPHHAPVQHTHITRLKIGYNSRSRVKNLRNHCCDGGSLYFDQVHALPNALGEGVDALLLRV